MKTYYNDEIDRRAEELHPGHGDPEKPYCEYLGRREEAARVLRGGPVNGGNWSAEMEARRGED